MPLRCVYGNVMSRAGCDGLVFWDHDRSSGFLWWGKTCHVCAEDSFGPEVRGRWVKCQMDDDPAPETILEGTYADYRADFDRFDAAVRARYPEEFAE